MLKKVKAVYRRWKLARKVAKYFAQHATEPVDQRTLAEELKENPADVAEMLSKMRDAGLLLSEKSPQGMMFSLNRERSSMAYLARPSAPQVVLRDHLVHVRGAQ